MYFLKTLCPFYEIYANGGVWTLAHISLHGEEVQKGKITKNVWLMVKFWPLGDQ